MSQEDASLQVLLGGADQLVHREELEERLRAGRPLRVKAGFDPTSPDLHLGHTVLIHKLRQFQDLGHTVIFLIGDFTGRIGDPSGRDITRPMLTEDELETNLQTYQDQVFRILDRERTEIRRNSEWMGSMRPEDMIRLASETTVARMLERDDFAKRYRDNRPIAVHEFLYPLVQGYDSVALEADVELGGTDQIFNLLVGRDLQKRHGQPPQIVMTMPLLEGTDGVRKMSKSYGNAIAIDGDSSDMYGQIMSLSDDLMWRYFSLLSLRPQRERAELRAAVEGGANPRDAKMQLARELVERFHGAPAAQEAQEDFVRRFRDHQIPEDLEEIAIEADRALALPNVLQRSGLCPSTSEARRMIKAGAVRLDGERSTDVGLMLAPGQAAVVQVGRRRIARVRLTPC